ncbi:MAG TPA: dihydroorotate dehydrogenase-like protein [Bacteroidales bacterium]|nr:dihydroorotate dehydrogenase-like protein [Bacteroidales bacterium]
MDLSTAYMGFRISNPLIVSSSGLTNSPENIRKCADNGAGAIVLKSLFEEQIVADKKKLLDQDDMYFWYPEAIDFVSRFSKEHGIGQYLKLIENAKKAVKIPLVASINCVSPREWPAFAKEIENAGADGIELNIFIPPTKMELTGYKIEETYLDIVREVRKNTNLPVGVKIGFYFSNLYRTIFKLSNLEIDNIVMFNRYYRPDIDIEKMQIVSNKVFSSPDEITLSLRWIALLSNIVHCNLIAATGIHDYTGVIKQIMAGASAVQLCTTLYKNGFEHISIILNDLENWMKNKKYNNLDSFKGIITKTEENCVAFERIQFMKKTTGNL